MSSGNPIKRVLVVDDEATVRDLLVAGLEGLDLEVATAADGAEALDCMRRLTPDLVLLDLAMPGMNGRDVLSALRADSALAGVRVLMLTGLQEIAGSGADEILPKPFDLLHLRSRVDFWLRN